MTDHSDPHTGGDFDAFLRDEGRLEEATEQAVKRVLAWQIEQEMARQGLTRTAMAAHMGTSRMQVNRLLNPTSDAMTLGTLKKAAGVLARADSD